MFEGINKFLGMVKDENFLFVIPNERCRKTIAIAITEMSRHNKNFVNLSEQYFQGCKREFISGTKGKTNRRKQRNLFFGSNLSRCF